MKLKTLKLFVVAFFATFAAGAFLFSSGHSQAQTGKSSEPRDEVLERVANYKNWKQVHKPEKTVDETSEKEAMPVFSTEMAA